MSVFRLIFLVFAVIVLFAMTSCTTISSDSRAVDPNWQDRTLRHTGY